MTRITTGCPRCGRIELEIDDITLVLSPYEGTAWYLFDCLTCVHRVVKPAPTSVAAALTSVEVRSWTVPAEVLERERPGERPPLGVDDLLDVLLWLRTGPEIDPGTPFRRPSPGGAGNRPARPNAA
ncbi:MAG: hypothetical protein QG622_1734 [Actinomycetota bacterium]|nr:hypothetical protein [Actinomycetota bacterium]